MRIILTCQLFASLATAQFIGIHHRVPASGTLTASAPLFSPGAGYFVAGQTVTLSSSTPTATICYTTDGTTVPAATTPGTCSTGSTYSGALTVAADEPIKAIATKSGYTNSSVVTGAFFIGFAPGNLVSSYDFVAPGSGSSMTDLTGSSTITLAGSPTWNAGVSITFNGTSQWGHNDSWNVDMTEGTLCYIVAATSLSSGAGYLSSVSDAGFDGLNVIYGFNAHTYELYSSVAIRIGSSISIADTNYHYLAYSKSKSGNRIYGYRDGTKVADYANALTLTTGFGLAIASSHAVGGDYFGGSIGYMLIYNRALSTTELLRNYNVLKAVMAGRGVSIP